MSSSISLTSLRGTLKTAELAMHLIEVQTTTKLPKLGEGLIPKMNMKKSKLPYKAIDLYQMTRYTFKVFYHLKELNIIVQQKGVVCKK